MKAIIFNLDETRVEGFGITKLRRRLTANDVKANYELTRNTTRDQYAYGEWNELAGPVPDSPLICTVDLNPQPNMVPNPAFDDQLPEDPVTNPAFIQDGTYNEPLATNIRTDPTPVVIKYPREIPRGVIMREMLQADLERFDEYLDPDNKPAKGTAERVVWRKVRIAEKRMMNGDPIDRDWVAVGQTVPEFYRLLQVLETHPHAVIDGEQILTAGEADRLFNM